ncbi:hypothetical protein BWL13_02718 [Microbacterium oleivorans]|uniref:hypothetical protein n=1 Tax=Microbacterium oleivorans TaxID=273677 RepID=UPI0009781329|nr:hypothetical protein [Microbacterium oleivorans]AZS45120.1 hypothetical protein BWL13_02718 [Microbacterium oleivorans]
MPIRFTPLDPTGADRDALITFMTSQTFPFHVRTNPTATQIADAIDDGAYADEDHASFWIDSDEDGRLGFFRLGWVQEAYYREGWPTDDGRLRASVAYSILRRDWRDGTVTPVVWDLPTQG